MDHAGPITLPKGYKKTKYDLGRPMTAKELMEWKFGGGEQREIEEERLDAEKKEKEKRMAEMKEREEEKRRIEEIR